MALHVIRPILFHVFVVVCEREVATIDHISNFAHCKCLVLWNEFRPPLELYIPCAP
jgi:hypothetical protein